MLPILHDGDVIYVKKLPFSSIKINDIVTIKRQRICITHRVVYKTKRYLVTKGDNNRLSDGRIYAKQILGIVKKIKRHNRIIPINSIYLYQSSQYLKTIFFLTKACKKNDLPFIFLKGLPYYIAYLKTYPKRFFSDCDILIEEKDIKKIDILLQKMGYIAEKEPKHNQFKFLDKNLKEKNYYRFTKEGLPIIIDVHRTITLSSSKADSPLEILNQRERSLISRFFSDVKMVSFQGVKIPLLKNEHLFIYLAIHLHKEKFSVTHNVDFIQNIVKKVPIDWIEVMDICKEEKIQNFIIPTLYLLQKYYNISYPYTLFKKHMPNETHYATQVLRLLYSEADFFDLKHSSFVRYKKALTIFLFIDEPLYKKIYYFLNTNFILHLFYSIFHMYKYTFRK